MNFRIIIGIASGLILVTVPLHLRELAPKDYAKLYGTLHQVSIGLGILTAQAFSLLFARPLLWRLQMVVATGVAVGLLLLGSLLRVRKTHHDHIGEDEDEETPLLAHSGKKRFAGYLRRKR